MSFKIVVDRDLCEGNARCVRVAPDVFRVDDDDKAHVLVENPGAELREKIDAAAALCPRQALAIKDE